MNNKPKGKKGKKKIALVLPGFISFTGLVFGGHIFYYSMYWPFQLSGFWESVKILFSPHPTSVLIPIGCWVKETVFVLFFNHNQIILHRIYCPTRGLQLQNLEEVAVRIYYSLSNYGIVCNQGVSIHFFNWETCRGKKIVMWCLGLNSTYIVY